MKLNPFSQDSFKLPKYFAIILMAIAATGAPSQADSGCAKLAISGGEKCSELKGNFELSGCKLGTNEAPAKIKCNGQDAAIAKARVGDSAFQASLSRAKGGAWGGGDWTAGPVTMEQRPAKSGSAAKKSVTAEKPSSQKAPVVKFTPPAGTAAASTGSALPAAPAPAQASASASATPSGLQFSALFDAYYAHNFNRPAPVAPGTTLPSPQNNLRYYDWYSNQLALNLVELTVKYTRKETSFLADFDFGHMADINAQAPGLARTGGPVAAAPDEVSKHLGQAIFTYTPASVPGLTLDVGKMATHIGLEVIKARDNWNYSRSTLFSFGIPLWHTGAHLGYEAIPKKLTAGLYVYQGWNTLLDNNAAPSLGAQLKYTPSDSLTFFYNYLGGPEQALNQSNLKQVHEANVTWNATSSVSLAADALLGSEEGISVAGGDPQKVTWSGLELLAHWQISPLYSISPRWEIYSDPNGHTLSPDSVGDSQQLFTYTLTQAFQVSEGFETRVELRWDHSSRADRFSTQGDPSANQTTVLIGLLYSM